MNKSYLFGALLTMAITHVSQAGTISLSTGTENFNGLLLEGSGTPNVGVIFFHGRGQAVSRLGHGRTVMRGAQTDHALQL